MSFFRKIIYFSFLILSILGVFGFAQAAFNEKINYQGKLTDTSNTAVADGAYDVVFNLYTVGGGGSAIWTESWTNAALWTESSITFTNDGCAAGVDKVSYTTVANEGSLAAGQQLWNTTKKESAVIESVVTASDYICVYDTPSAWATTDGATNRVYVKNGLFSVMLGGASSISAINLNQTLYLGVTVGADSEMKPRKMIGAVPAAIEAKQLGGKTWATPDAIGSGTPNTGAFTSFSSTGLTTVGNNSATVAIDSSDWNIDALGAMTGISGITSDSTYTQTAGNFAMSGIGTFGTGSGAVSLNGDTTIAANKNLIITAGTGKFSVKDRTVLTEANSYSNFGYNLYYDGAWKRVNTGEAGVNLHITPTTSTEFRFARIEADGTNHRNLAQFGSGTSYISEGNFGIGDTTPDGKLDVESTGAVTAANYGINLSNLATSSTSSINKYGAYISSTGTWNGTSANNYGLYVDTPTGGTNNYAAVFAGGNVGIGTATPDAALNVASGQISFGSVWSLALFNVSTNFSTAGNSVGMRLVSVLTPASGSSVYGLNLAPTAGSSTENIADASTILVTPPAKGNSGTLTNLYGVKIATSASTSTNAYGLYVDAPSGGSSVNAAAYFGGNVGIGTTAPAYSLDIQKDGDNAIVNTITYGATFAGSFYGASARGTQASPTASQLDDLLGVFGAKGYGATGFSAWSKAVIMMKAAENWTDSAQGTYMLFATTAAGGTTRSERMRITDAGYVGIGLTPTYQFQISTDSAGKPNGGSWANSSDMRLKTNIEPITGELALSKILQLQGVNFDWINPEVHGNMTGVQGGFIAQEVEKVFPKWISEIDSSGKDVALVGEGKKIKSLSLPFEYDAYMVEAIKEQQKQIEELKLTINPSGNIMDSSGEAIIASLGQSQSFKDLVTSTVKDALVSLNGTVIAAGEWTFEKITTKQICIEDVCVDRNQLQELLQKNQEQGINNVTTSEPILSQTPEPTQTITPALEPSATPFATPESTAEAGTSAPTAEISPSPYSE